MKKDDFTYLLDILKQYAGWEFDESSYFILDKKIYNFVREKEFPSIESLMSHLRSGNKVLLWNVVEHLALSDTSFYRDCKVFKGFENYVFPMIREENRGVKKMRIWSLGCSTGQETYSVAFIVKKKLVGLENWDIDIIGTDLSSPSINKAQKGAYSQFEVQMGLNMRDILDNFEISNEALKDEARFDKDVWQIKSDIMEMVKFRHYNILNDLTFSDKFDVVFCRNVLRFFDKGNQRKIIEKIFNYQIPGGFLYLGMGEYVEGLEEFYEKVQGLKCLYKSRTLANQNAPKENKPSSDMPTFRKPNVLNIP